MIIWQVKTPEGNWITNEDMFWLDLPEPLKEIHVMGYPIQQSDFYFFIFNAVALPFCPGKITGITFGGINNGNIMEYRITKDGVKRMQYKEDNFTYAKNILKRGR